MTLTSLTFANGSLNVYSPLSVDYLVLGGGTINNNSYAATSMTLNGWSDGKSGLWSGGTINLATSLTNSGTFTLGSEVRRVRAILSLGGTAALINQGNIIQTGTYNLVLDSFSPVGQPGELYVPGGREHYKHEHYKRSTDTPGSSPTQARSRRRTAPAKPSSAQSSTTTEGRSMWRRAR